MPRRDRLRRLAAPAFLPLVLLAGCGGGEGLSTVPQSCLSSWNSETEPRTSGQHTYDDHGARQAWIHLAEVPPDNPRIPGEETCAVIFVVPPSDIEYGNVGEVVGRGGWTPMRALAPGDPALLREIQAAAGGEANAILFPDGTLQAD